MSHSKVELSRAGVRLTRQEMSHRSGCLCKLAACDLEMLLDDAFATAYGADAPAHPMRQPEDCAVIRSGGQRLLATTDLGPWVGVDLYTAGRIAAFHAMSDVFACGGIPKWALVTLIVKAGDPPSYGAAVMAGILDASREEALEICGGHTLVGGEAMAGLAILGVSRPGVHLSKIGAQVGNHVLLSKPLGVGIMTRAYKLALADDTDFEKAVEVMNRSNGPAAEQAVKAGVAAATDVTGFGLLGHLAEMLAPGQGAKIGLSSVPRLEPLARLDPGLGNTYWTKSNMDYVVSKRPLRGAAELAQLLPLLDPQTNGGLLVAAGDEATAQLKSWGFHPIGRVTADEVIEIGD